MKRSVFMAACFLDGDEEIAFCTGETRGAMDVWNGWKRSQDSGIRWS